MIETRTLGGEPNMISRDRIGPRALALFASTIALIASATAQEIGVNAAVKNDVNIQSEEELEARTALVGGDVMLNDLITSGEASALQVLLLDETVFTVGPDAEVVIDRFIYDPNQDSGEMAASVARGAFRFMSGRTASDPENVTIESPVASMGVRGTVFEAVVGRDAILDFLGGNSMGGTLEDGATLVVLRGPGRGHSSLNKDGAVIVENNGDRKILTKSNTAVLVPSKDGQMIGPFSLPRGALNRFSDLLRTSPTGDLMQPMPPLTLPTALELDEDPTEPWFGPEDTLVVDRPIGFCPNLNSGLVVLDNLLFSQDEQGRLVLVSQEPVIEDCTSFIQQDFSDQIFFQQDPVNPPPVR